MSQKINRRAFLKGGLSAAGLIASSAIPAKALQKNESDHIATLLDLRKCIGCEECVEACRDTNRVKFPEPSKPFPKMYPSRVKVSDWSDKKDETERLTPYNWIFIQRAQIEKDGEEIEINIPRRCMHCVNPPCVKLCPWGAAKQFENGISKIDSNICLGGSKCNKVCPWDIPQRQTGVGLYLDILPSLAGNGVMFKCDRCYNKVANGELPACVEACPEGVQTIGKRKEIIRKAHQIVAEEGGYIYGENENGGTNTIYISPVPFDRLDEAVETGKGKPHLKPVDDKMNDANNLATAMVLAPFAGLAAAVSRFYVTTRNKGEK